ncbi:hypothetical protein [Chryseobacterium gregarium]|uniref:hypothetical protein n=1 Tax=Chryseobacterium gregarium TaxID=456299 RepID=UPI000486207E|nr:hypothetical protein [Chryseobacterium gregarium]
MTDTALIKLYKQEVKELTILLRTEWKDIQEIANSKNLDLNKTYLMGFVESKDDEESGILFNIDKGLFFFEKDQNGVVITNKTKSEIQIDFPQVVLLPEISDFDNW